MLPRKDFLRGSIKDVFVKSYGAALLKYIEFLMVQHMGLAMYLVDRG